MNNLTRRGVVISGAVAISGAFPGIAQAATGSVRMKIVSAGFILGAAGGDGILVFRGRSYPLSVGGISAGATIGVSGADLVGTAYHLQDARDIEGVYNAIGAGVAVAAGATAVDLSNARGVIMRLRGRQVGFKFSFALSGLTINIK
jgi:lipid-binding SYLF domain-containing protein